MSDHPDPSAPHLDPATIDAVVFDIGGVFVLPHPDPIVDHLARQGVTAPTDPERYRRAHHRGIRALWQDAGTAVEEQRTETWRRYDVAYLDELGIAEGDRASAHAGLSAAFGLPVPRIWNWVQDHNVTGFRRIATAFPVAIVSNNDGSAESSMRELGVCQVGPGAHTEVVIVVDSALVKVAKPDPAIFTPALAALGVEPARALYVGDTLHADVNGATAAGMPVVQLDPFDHHADFDHHRLPDVGAIADLLGCP